uniref:Nonstructural protein NSP1.pep2 n=1 Tax=Porcine rotavirus B TaxID=449582 RepID=G3XHK4_9REOV|nr:nonstructural protein NSP1.pep2 [Porcine rotavirus B]
MDLVRFIAQAKQKKDLIPIYLNNSFDPTTLSKKPLKLELIRYNNPFREVPSLAGESILLEDVCPYNHEHFCGGIHIPKQFNMSPKGRISHITSEKIAWPCGLKSIIIDGREYTGSAFVKCRCGQQYPTIIDQQSTFFFLTCCSNDTKSVKIGLSEKFNCMNCNRSVRWFSPGRGLQTTHQHYLPSQLCPACMPFRDIVASMSLLNRVKFLGADFDQMRTDFEWKRQLQNNCESAFRSFNSPQLAHRVTPHERVETNLTINTVTETVSSVNRKQHNKIEITPVCRGKVAVKDGYRRCIIDFQDNAELYRSVNMLLLSWKLI